MMGLRQEAKRIAEEADKQGFEVKKTTRGHWQFFLDGIYICDLGGTPGSQREITGKVAKLRKHGFIYGRR
jgi:hypothetical protein